MSTLFLQSCPPNTTKRCIQRTIASYCEKVYEMGQKKRKYVWKGRVKVPTPPQPKQQQTQPPENEPNVGGQAEHVTPTPVAEIPPVPPPVLPKPEQNNTGEDSAPTPSLPPPEPSEPTVPPPQLLPSFEPPAPNMPPTPVIDVTEQKDSAPSGPLAPSDPLPPSEPVPVTPPPVYSPTKSELEEFENARRQLSPEAFSKILTNLVLTTSPTTFSSCYTPCPDPDKSETFPDLPSPPIFPTVNESDMFPVLLSHIAEVSLIHAVHDMIKHYSVREHKVVLDATWKGCEGRLTFLQKITTSLVRWLQLMGIHRTSSEEDSSLLFLVGTLRMLTCVYSVPSAKIAYSKDVQKITKAQRSFKRRQNAKKKNNAGKGSEKSGVSPPKKKPKKS